MNPGTKTAKFAYAAGPLAAYVDSRTQVKRLSRVITRRGREFTTTYEQRYVNNRPWNHNISGRTLLRWVRGQVEVSRLGAAKLLESYGLTTGGFERWAKRNQLNPVLRDITKEAKDGQQNSR